MDKMFGIDDIAKISHVANKAYCESIGDNSQVCWSEAPDWQKESAVKGVELHLNNPDLPASASHDAWMKHKLSTGWKYGPVKDPEKKEHPNLVSFWDLPIREQAKDLLFSSIVRCLKPMLGR